MSNPDAVTNMSGKDINTATVSASSSSSASASASSSSSEASPSFVSNQHCFVPDPSVPCSLVLLNTNGSFASLDRVWKATNYRIVADGAANHLYRTVVLHSLWTEYLHHHPATSSSSSSSSSTSVISSGLPPSQIFSFIATHVSPFPSPSSLSSATLSLLRQYIPDCICGDWDSIQPEIEEFYAGLGVHIIKDPDQDSNDLVKCLHQVEQHNTNLGISTRVIVYGAFGGRFDQEMNNVNSLYKFSTIDNHPSFRQVTLLSDDCLASFIPIGTTDIQIAYPYEGPLCGLIPLGQTVSSLTTHGLHWDVTNWTTEFGGMVSTSNHIAGYPYSHPLIDNRKGSDGTVTAEEEKTKMTKGGDREEGEEKTKVKLPMMVRIVTTEPIIWTASVKFA